MDIIVINGQLTAVKKGIRWPVSYDRISGSIVQLTEVLYFLKLSADLLLVLIDPGSDP